MQNLKNKSHCYLIESDSRIRLEQLANEFKQTIICETQTMCGTCIACKKVVTNNYADVIEINGFEGSIKKEAVLKVQNQFSYSAIEKNGVKVYTIHAIDNISQIAANSLLKFIEEPPANTYAIFTTLNYNRVLETIKSRAAVVKAGSIPKAEKVEILKKLNLEEELIEIIIESNSEYLNITEEHKQVFALANKFDYQTLLIDFKGDKVAIELFVNIMILNSKNKKSSLMEDLLDAKQKLKGNINPKLVFEALDIKRR